MIPDVLPAPEGAAIAKAPRFTPGPVSGHQEVDIGRARAKEVTQARFTSLDRELERRAKDNRVEVRFADRPGLVEPSTLIARLVHLEGLRLAERLSPTSRRLAEGWQQPLRDLAARGDILKQIHAAISGDPARYRIVRDGEAVPTDAAGGSRVVSGRVASKGLSDELKGTFYAVIETPTGRAYHVPLDARGAEARHLPPAMEPPRDAARAASTAAGAMMGGIEPEIAESGPASLRPPSRTHEDDDRGRLRRSAGSASDLLAADGPHPGLPWQRHADAKANHGPGCSGVGDPVAVPRHSRPTNPHHAAR